MTQTINGNDITLYEPCACDCGNLTRSPKATFIPGHDAKLVSKLAKQMYVAVRDGDTVEEFGLETRVKRFSYALQGKIHGAFRLAKIRGARVASAKREATHEAAALDDLIDALEAPKTVKVGRWEYPAKVTFSGRLLRNTKRDGSGEWVQHQEEVAA